MMSGLSVWGTLLGQQKHDAEAPAGCDRPLHGLMLLWRGKTMTNVVVKYSRNQEFCYDDGMKRIGANTEE